MAVKEKIDAEYLAELLHTALRKQCDSTPTSIAWNVINLLDSNTWKEYTDAVLKELVSKRGEKQIVAAVKKASLGWRVYGNYAGVSLSCAFKLFDNDDWYGYSSYLFDFDMG